MAESNSGGARDPCEDSPHRHTGVEMGEPSDSAGGRESRSTATLEN